MLDAKNAWHCLLSECTLRSVSSFDPLLVLGNRGNGIHCAVL